MIDVGQRVAGVDDDHGLHAVAAHPAGRAAHPAGIGHAVPPRLAEALGVQLVAQVAKRVGFAVVVGGDRGAASGDEVGAVEADLGQLGAQVLDLAGQGGSVGQGVVDLAPERVRVGKTSEKPSMM